MKRCFKCGTEKPFDEFYRHKKMVDGTLGKCKECTKKDVAARVLEKRSDPEWLAAERERCREKSRRAREAGTSAKTSTEAKSAWKKRNPTKSRAHEIARRANRERPDACWDCGKPADILHRHHPDYAKPKEIVWLCPACHGIRHQK